MERPQELMNKQQKKDPLPHSSHYLDVFVVCLFVSFFVSFHLSQQHVRHHLNLMHNKKGNIFWGLDGRL